MENTINTIPTAISNYVAENAQAAAKIWGYIKGNLVMPEKEDLPVSLQDNMVNIKYITSWEVDDATPKFIYDFNTNECSLIIYIPKGNI